MDKTKSHEMELCLTSSLILLCLSELSDPESSQSIFLAFKWSRFVLFEHGLVSATISESSFSFGLSVWFAQWETRVFEV